MKKMFFLVIALFSCSIGFASPVEKGVTIASKAILENTQGFFVLSDCTCWKVIAFSPRSRSFSEWWNSAEIVPSSYDGVLNDWNLGAEVEVYSKHDNLMVNEADALNQEDLKQCTHLLVNTSTRQVLFAIAIYPSECIVQLTKEMHADGYKKGHSEGLLAGNKKCTSIAKDALANEVHAKEMHAAGYKKGHSEGLQASNKNCAAIAKDAQANENHAKEMHADGYKKGYSEGLQAGDKNCTVIAKDAQVNEKHAKEMHADGYKKGYSEGLQAGNKNCADVAKDAQANEIHAEEMHADGYKKGYSEGLQAGNKKCADIAKDAHAKGYKLGYSEGCQSTRKEAK